MPDFNHKQHMDWLNEQKTPEEWANTPATAPDGSLIVDDEVADLTDEQADAINAKAEAAEVTIDEFQLVVTYINERTNSVPPTFADYDEAREAGIDLLLNHADAASFSIVKSTRLA